MDKNSKFHKLLSSLVEQKEIPPKLGKILSYFIESYLVATNHDPKNDPIFLKFLDLIRKECQTPYQFEPFHKCLREPIDYHAFGKDFIRPLIEKDTSFISGKERLSEITNHIQNGDNVVFFANHQTEADPQAISILLEDEYPNLSEEIIFVAGERVITDTLSIPFSLGCNLLCIYSKRYIDHPLEEKHQKQLHNKKTMQLMSSLLKEGGKCIYVAPSGGRDRKNADGEIILAPFDPQAIEMFYLMAKKSKTPTFFYPMALGTYDLLPPPETIQVELGEHREVNQVGIHLSIGSEIDMQNYPGSENPDKHVRRKSRADYIWKLVHDDYQKFLG